MPKMMPKDRNVKREFFHSGGLKTNTPSEMASTPVSAVQPAANARKMRNKLKEVVAILTGVATGEICPVTVCSNPKPMSKKILTIKQYVE